jgi:hypothetical protein
MDLMRDIYQRKVYALLRMNLALARMKKSVNEKERNKALSWVNAWLAISGLRQFKLVPESRRMPSAVQRRRKE